jgi:hypothetical protein
MSYISHDDEWVSIVPILHQLKYKKVDNDIRISRRKKIFSIQSHVNVNEKHLKRVADETPRNEICNLTRKVVIGIEVPLLVSSY